MAEGAADGEDLPDNQLKSPLINDADVIEDESLNSEPTQSFDHSLSRDDDDVADDEEDKLNNSIKESVSKHDLENPRQSSECYKAICEHDIDSIENIVWWIFVVILSLLAIGSTAITIASTSCFVRSWHDKRHWWPNNLATDHLDKKFCPVYWLHWDGWEARRLALAAMALLFGIFAFLCYNLLYQKIASRLRERRLEVSYPWLSRFIDSAVNSRDADGSKARAKMVAAQKRQQAKPRFEKAFSKRMIQVHDSTLSIQLSFTKLCVDAGSKRLLHEVSGGVRASRVTAFMGPSGAGKSTLMHALCGKVDVTSGEVLVNGAKSKMKDLTKLVGFVPQDDILLGMLTVKEILRFHAHLRLPIHIGISIREGWIDNCIDLLGLTDVKHSLVGDATQRGISGGQRRRVNIGAELVSDPSILFLDEPTSGLDSSAALEVMRCLQLAANEGMTVCCVIHQPRTSVYELFDDLLLLGRSSARYGGRTVYYGPAADATAYFEGLHFHFPVKENPADVFIDIVSGNKQPETTANSALSAAVEEEVVVDEPSIDVVMKPLADLWDEHYLKNDPNAPARESDESSLMEDEGLSSPKGRKMRKMTLSSLKSLGDTRLAYRTMESALANLSVRLRDHQGRHTPNYFIQFLLFMDRQVTQLCRRFPIVLKNVIMFVIAGLILGALYSDVLDDWPDGGNGYCDDEKYDDGDSRSKSNCGRHGDDDPELQPHMEQGDCLHRIWPAIESDMDINYRQVFTLALLGMALLSVQSSLDLFGEERLIFLRESRHHMAWTYACGKMVAATPLSFFYPFCFTAVFHTLFNPMASFSDYYWTFMMTGLASEGLGIFLSIAFPDTRQVAGGVFALVMAMFTGCFPLFADGGSTRGVGFFSFLRYSAQLLFRFEYLAYVGLLPKFGCAKSGTYESESSCLKPKGFDRNSFWLPPDSPSEYNTTFQDCPLPWDYYGHYGNETISINDDDDYEKKHNDDDQWDVQCCSVNLYFKIKDLMRDDYGYVMHPDFSFLKLLAFSAAFRFAGILILAWKDLAKRR